MLQHEKNIIFKYHEHQTLLENKEDEVLDEEERKAAWEEYENEKKSHNATSGFINNVPIPQIMLALRNILLRKNPSFTNTEIGKYLPENFKLLQEQLASGNYSVKKKRAVFRLS